MKISGGITMNLFKELFDSENGKLITIVDYLKSGYMG